MNELNPIQGQVWWYAYRFDYGASLPSFKRMTLRAYLNKVGPWLEEYYVMNVRLEIILTFYRYKIIFFLKKNMSKIIIFNINFSSFDY